jgi:endoglycosylceramidase
VILRGFNMLYKVDSYRPEDTGFGPDDARFLRRHGFNSIRLGIIYRAFPPTT